jgi:poly(beta-D-mannuronate) C5 epimerase
MQIPLHSRTIRKRSQRIWKALLYVTAIYLVTVSAIAALTTGATTKVHKPLRAFPHRTPRPPYVVAPDPIHSSEQGLPPTTTNGVPKRPSWAIRTIEVFPTRIILLRGGKKINSIAFDGQHATLPNVAATIGRPSWIKSSKGTVTLNTALVMEKSTVLRVSGPTTKIVNLVDRPGVLLGSRGAVMHLTRVHITSTAQRSMKYHPFVLADYKSRLDIVHSVFTGLGYDWNGSYGISWLAGSSGYAVDSKFANNFIGIYTDRSANLAYVRNTLSHNQLYGFDPHSYSSHILIANNEAYGNGRHGIIFSNHVTHSQVLGNYSHDNGENGIMMDEHSTSNLISRNRSVGNHGDGIVLAASGFNTVTYNQVVGNRVGLQASKVSRQGQIAHNQIVGNLLASQGLNPLNATNIQRDSLRQKWNIQVVLAVICASTLLLIVLSAAFVNVVFGKRSSNPLALSEG